MTRFGAQAGMMAHQGWLHQHGEEVLLSAAGQPARSVTAIVRRGPMGAHAPNEYRLEYALSVYIPRSELPEVRVHADTVAVRRRRTDTHWTTCQVVRVLADDAGMWHLALN